MKKSQLKQIIKECILETIHPTDEKQGVVGYWTNIVPCPTCGKPTNLLFKNSKGKASIGCCQACVDNRMNEQTMETLTEVKQLFASVKDQVVEEAIYKGRRVKLNKPMRGDAKKFKVYVKDPKTGNIKKVNFGDPNMRIKKSNPKRRKSFRARHKCSNPGPKTKARYWSCRKW